MGSEGSYRLSDIEDKDREIARLREQVLLAWRQEAQVLRDRGVHHADHVLEVGAGPGFVTEQLLSLAPQATVTAMDNDPEMVRLARSLLDEHPRVRHLEASVTDTGMPEASVDASYARFVFEHLPDPAAALDELFRVTRPGGTVIILDVDDGLWGFGDPPLPSADAVLEAMGAVQAKQGGDRTIGRKLWGLLDAAGFADLELRLVTAHSDEIGSEPFLRSFGGPERLEPLVAAGLLDRSVLDAFARDQGRLRDGGYILLVFLAVSGRRPAQ